MQTVLQGIGRYNLNSLIVDLGLLSVSLAVQTRHSSLLLCPSRTELCMCVMDLGGIPTTVLLSLQAVVKGANLQTGVDGKTSVSEKSPALQQA